MMKIIFETHGTKIWNVNYRGYPNVSAKWKFPNGQFISNSTEFSVVLPNQIPGNDKSTIQLQIHNPELQQSGVYELFVYNDQCNKSESFTLIVKSKEIRIFVIHKLDRFYIS